MSVSDETVGVSINSSLVVVVEDGVVVDSVGVVIGDCCDVVDVVSSKVDTEDASTIADIDTVIEVVVGDDDRSEASSLAINRALA